MSESRDVYSRITNKIIADLEHGVRPWMKPWSAEHAAGRITRPLRHNGIPYKGINVVMLWSASVTKGYACPLWLTFPPAEARRLAERFEWHYTPKHGSWLNMAESELGVLSSQCLDRRIEDNSSLVSEVAAWQAHRNKHHAKANWQFTIENARTKISRLYPSL